MLFYFLKIKWKWMLRFVFRYKYKWAASWQNQQCSCAPSEDSDQPRHPPSLIRVFAVRMKKASVLSYHWAHSEDPDQTGRMPRLIWVFAGRTATLLVLSWCGSNNNLIDVLYSRKMIFQRLLLWCYEFISPSKLDSCERFLRRIFC